MEQVSFGAGADAYAPFAGGRLSDRNSYIQGLMAQAYGHGGGHDSFAHSGHGGGHAQRKPNRLAQAIGMGLAVFLGWKFKLHTKALDFLRSKGITSLSSAVSAGREGLKRVWDGLTSFFKGKGEKAVTALAKPAGK